MSSAASVVMRIWPMSSSGKKPFGMVTNSHAVATKVSSATSSTTPRWRSATVERARVAAEQRVEAALERAARCAARAASSCASSLAGSGSPASAPASARRTPTPRSRAPTMTANSWNSRPITPGMKKIGMNTATSEIEIEMMVKPTSREPRSAAWNGGIAVLDVAHDVLEHHDRVVDDQADRQRDAEQRDVVEAVAEGPEQRDRADQRDRQRQRRDQRGRRSGAGTGRSPAPPARWCRSSVSVHVVQRVADRHRAVVDQVDLAPTAAAATGSAAARRAPRRPPSPCWRRAGAGPPARSSVSPLKLPAVLTDLEAVLDGGHVVAAAPALPLRWPTISSANSAALRSCAVGLQVSVWRGPSSVPTGVLALAGAQRVGELVER